MVLHFLKINFIKSKQKRKIAFSASSPHKPVCHLESHIYYNIFPAGGSEESSSKSISVLQSPNCDENKCSEGRIVLSDLDKGATWASVPAELLSSIWEF